MEILDMIGIEDSIMQEIKSLYFLNYYKVNCSLRDYVLKLLTTDTFDKNLPSYIIKLKPYIILNIFSTNYISIFGQDNLDNIDPMYEPEKIKQVLLKNKNLLKLIEIFKKNPSFSKKLIGLYYESNRKLEFDKEEKIRNLRKKGKIKDLIKINPYLINADLNRILENKPSKEEEIISFILDEYEQFSNTHFDYNIEDYNEEEYYDEEIDEYEDYDEEIDENEYEQLEIELFETLKIKLIRKYLNEIDKVIPFILSNVYENKKTQNKDYFFPEENDEIIDYVEGIPTIKDINRRFITDRDFCYSLFDDFIYCNIGKRRKQYKKIRKEIEKIGKYSLIKKYNSYLPNKEK